MEKLQDFLKKIEWKQLAIALAAMGVISTSDPEAAIISVVAMIIVALVNLTTKSIGKPVGRGPITILVYLVALVMAVLSNPPASGLPTWAGDPADYAAQIAVLIAAFGPYALALTGSATILYNALAKLVFEKIEDFFVKA